jgi:salicylate 5-hydroxylase small subunit
MIATQLDPATRFAVADLYADYVACIDDGRFAEWPAFFTAACSYRIVTRENDARGLPLALLSFESRGMLEDRTYSITESLFHAPYYQRHSVTNFQLRPQSDGSICVGANYTILRTKHADRSEIFSAGRCRDRVVTDGGGLRFAEKVFVADTEMVLNSLIYPF